MSTFTFFLAGNAPTVAEGNKITELRVHGGNEVKVWPRNAPHPFDPSGTDYAAAMQRASVPQSAHHLLCLLYDGE